MNPEVLLGGVALAALIAYGVLAGADFGGGVWDLFARGERREAQRAAIAQAMAPVWEANHVWLIFVVVLLFSGFPPAFAALGVGLFVPFHLALVGITLRGAAFVFRAYGPQAHGATSRWGTVFGASSAVTPALLGACLGAVSSGGLRVREGEVTGQGAWLGPFALGTGALALALCAYLAAVFLTHETEGVLREDFRRRALVAGTFVVALSVLEVPLAMVFAPHLARALLSPRARWVLAAGAVAALASGGALLARRYGIARVASVAQVALLIAGWGLAHEPYLIYPDLTLMNAAAPRATQWFILATLPPGAALLVPSLWLLFRVFKSSAHTERAR